MDLKDPIEGVGFFWLPEEPERRLPGVLRISAAGSVELEINCLSEGYLPIKGEIPLGVPSFSDEKNTHGKVFGLVKIENSDKFVALANCLYTNYTISMTGGISSSIIHVDKAFVSDRFDFLEGSDFVELRFSFPALDEWLHLSGSKVSLNLGNEGKVLGVKVDYTPPEKRNFKLPNDMVLEFNFNSTIPTTFGTVETKITQKAFVSIRSASPLPLDDLLEVASYICDFFSLCTDTSVVYEVVEGYLGREKSDAKAVNRNARVKVYYESAPKIMQNRKINRHVMLLNFSNFGERFEKAIGQWISSYSELGPVFDSFFSSVSGSYSRLEGRYLALVQGIETLHRRKMQKPVVTDEKYSKIVNNMLECVPNSMRQHFRNRLLYGNEPTLSNRIQEVLNPNLQFFKFDTFKKEYCRLIVDTRNFLTHFDRKLERRAATGIELHRLCLNFEALYSFIFLRNLGFSDNEIQSILDSSTHLKHKLIPPGRFDSKII